MEDRVRQRWADLTDHDIDAVFGKRDALCGKIQERYGITRQLAEKELRDFESELSEFDFNRSV